MAGRLRLADWRLSLVTVNRLISAALYCACGIRASSDEVSHPRTNRPLLVGQPAETASCAHLVPPGFNVPESWCMFRETPIPDAADGISHTPNEGEDDRTLAHCSVRIYRVGGSAQCAAAQACVRCLQFRCQIGRRVMLFDDLGQRNSTYSGSESRFQSLNRDGGPDAMKIRDRLESWFDEYPSDHQLDLRNRFRSDDDNNHEGAFFELFLHELLTRMGLALEVHPQIDGMGTKPDFLASHGDLRFYLEATMVGQRSGPFTRSRNEQDVIDKLKQLTSPNFNIGVHMEGELVATWARNAIIQPFRRLLNAHNPDDVQRLIDERGRRSAPCEMIEADGWRLKGFLFPIAAKNRGSDPARQIRILNALGKRTDSVTPIRTSIKENARKYARLRASLVVAVNARDMFYSGTRSDMQLLFGDEQLLYSKDQLELPPRVEQRPNGLWSRDSRIAAFLRFQRVDLCNLWHRPSVCLYTNPYCANVRFPDALFRMPHAKACDGEMRWFDGEEISRLLGIEDGSHGGD